MKQKKQKIYSAICGIILLFMFSLPVNADVPVAENTERKTVSGVEYIVKTYNVNKSVTAKMLKEDDFEQDGYRFTYTKTDKKENVSEQSKYVTKPMKIETSTNSASAILKQFTESVNYGEDGYYGTLPLDAGSLVTQPKGYGARNVPIYRTREYKGLMYNDPSYVAQSITDSGETLSLTGVEWVVTGTALAGDSLVPTEYKAVAQYAGSQRVTYVTGYTTTVNYAGIVTKKTVDSVTYTITYTGTLIPVPTTTEPPTTTEAPTTTAIETTIEPSSEDNPEPQNGNGVNLLLIGIIIALLTAAGIGFAFVYNKYIAKKEQQTAASVYNLIDSKYILLGTVPLDESEPIVGLNQFAESVQSGNFGLSLDKHSAEALDGKAITVAYNGQTLSHIVQTDGNMNEYTFNLTFNTDKE